MERVYKISKGKKKELEALMAKDPYAPISFGRISPVVKEKDDAIFIYVKSEEDAVFKFVEEELKAVEGKRAEEKEEKEIIEMIHKEEESAAGGFGAIFE
ncbi:MAG: hypothetical protein N3G74_00840 [Candidatus Micrarchaeota archaeon]|nr:hypothetical protein [Candidatus Micrarchaeota archaeon]